MTHQSGSVAFPVSTHMVFPHIGKHRLQYHLILRRSQRAVRIGNNIMRPARIESGHKIPCSVIPHRELCLIAVMPWLFHAHHRLHDLTQKFPGESPDPDQIIPHFIRLVDKLPLIAHGLDLAPTALPVEAAFRLHTKRRRCHHLLYSRITVILPALRDPRLHRITNDRILNEKSIAAALADPLSVAAHILYRHCDNVIFSVLPVLHTYLSAVLLLQSALLSILYLSCIILSSYSSLVPRTFDSNSLLNPSQPVSFVLSSNSVKVSILASVLSAKVSATASTIAGFFGEPNSYSP